MKQKDYPGIWKHISTRSRTAIVETTAKGVSASYTRGQVETDFSIGGLIAKSYWDEYLRYFDADTVLEQSIWEMGPVSREQAESSCNTVRQTALRVSGCSTRVGSGRLASSSPSALSGATSLSGSNT